jgi:predicted RNA-binding Zn ribbon-like protein
MAKSKPAVKFRRPAFAWGEHSFLNRDLALDFANTVVYRHVPGRRDDRLTNRRAVDRWAMTSGSAVRLGRDARLGEAIRIREAIDAFFRHAALTGVPDAVLWRRLVTLYLRHGVLVPARTVAPSLRPPADLFSALLLAALETAFSPHMRRIKVCPSCGWLFIDRTRNGGKRWCIPSLCGNRARARRFYERRTARRAGSDLTGAAR